jgi:hypothetical protein
MTRSKMAKLKLSEALKKFLRGRKLIPPRQIQPAAATSYG